MFVLRGTGGGGGGGAISSQLRVAVSWEGLRKKTLRPATGASLTSRTQQ